MDQQCLFVKVNQQIHGICMKSSCLADPRIHCLKCIELIHSDCNLLFSEKGDFIEKLLELKKNLDWPSEILDLLQTTQKLINSLKELQQFMERKFLEYRKMSPVDLINQNEQARNLTEELKRIQRAIDKITQVQSGEYISRIRDKNEIMKPDWNNITLSQPRTIDTHHEISTIALSPDGEYIASAGGNGDFNIKIWNPNTGMQVGNGMHGHKDWIDSINYSKSGMYLVSASQDMTIRQWNVQTQQQIGQALMGHEYYVLGVQYTPDSRHILSCSWDKTLRLWNSETGIEQIDKRILNANEIWCLSLSPTQNNIAFGDTQGIIIIYNYEGNYQEGYSFKGHSKCVSTLSYSADGKYIVSGGEDQSILLWNVKSREQIASFIGHNKTITSLNLSPDMKYVISGGYDKTIRLWYRITGKLIGQPLTHHKAVVRSTQFSLDGKYLITGGDDKQLRIMVVPIDIEEEYDC